MHSENFNIPPKKISFVKSIFNSYRVTYWNKLPPLRFRQSKEKCPQFVQQCATTQKLINFLLIFDWDCLQISQKTSIFHAHSVSIATYISSLLVKTYLHQPTMPQFRNFLIEHPALIWALGYPLYPAPDQYYGFDIEQSLPTSRHFTRVLRELDPNFL